MGDERRDSARGILASGLAGPRSVASAFALLARERALWPLCLGPCALTAALLIGALVLFAGVLFDPIQGYLAIHLTPADPASWYGWLWVGPWKLLAAAFRWLLLVLAFVLMAGVFVALGGILSAPFLDALSLRVERIANPAAPPPEARSGLRTALQAALEEGKRVAFGAAVLGALALAGLIPGLQPIAALAAFGFSTLLLSLEYTAYSLDRRGVSFADRRRWLWRHRLAMLGFGGVSLLSYGLPGLNFVSLPLLVTAGTLLTLELGPPRGGESRRGLEASGSVPKG